MTPAFAVGEVAILQNCLLQSNNGRECVITAGPTYYQMLKFNNMVVFGYQVACKNGDEYTAIPLQLRKKRPPESDDAVHRQAMLDCIERAKMGQGETV